MIALDANILIRAVLGRRARRLVESYATPVRKIATDAAICEAREHLVEMAAERRLARSAVEGVLERMLALIETAGPELYEPFAGVARQLIDNRDPDDWPTLALSLARVDGGLRLSSGLEWLPGIRSTWSSFFSNWRALRSAGLNPACPGPCRAGGLGAIPG